MNLQCKLSLHNARNIYGWLQAANTPSMPSKGRKKNARDAVIGGKGTKPPKAESWLTFPAAKDQFVINQECSVELWRMNALHSM